MDEVFENWNKYILKEQFKDYVHSDMVKLFHYSRVRSADSLVLDPNRFVTNRNSYSKNEYNASTFPRVFFYLDKEKTERNIASGTLFTAEVPASDIYDIRVDVEDLLKKSKKATGQVVPDIHKVLKALAGKDKATPGYEEHFVPIRDSSSKIYKGIHYAISHGSIPVVAWFEHIEVYKELPEGERGEV